jgi:hypothetical protein
VVLLADEKGRIHSFKLFPNIRKNKMPTKALDEESKLSKSGSAKQSRGILSDLTQPQAWEDGKVAEERRPRGKRRSRRTRQDRSRSVGVRWFKQRQRHYLHI